MAFKLFIRITILLFLIVYELAGLLAHGNDSSRFSLFIKIGSLYSDWQLNSSELLGDGITQSSRGSFGYYAGAGGTVSWGRYWQVAISARIESRHIEYQLDGLHFDVDFTGTGFNDSHIIYDAKATFLRVPLTVEYFINDKRFTVSFLTGLSYDMLIKNNTERTVYYSTGATEPVGTDNFYNDHNVSVIGGMGINFRPAKRFCLSLHPLFSYSFLKDEFNMHQYSIGAMGGISLNL